MRHGTSSRRSRNRGGGGRRGNQNRMQVFDSNGPDVRIRGTAHQIHEKYMALAKDAASSGDKILAESYLQHAEHYQRVINKWEQDVRSPQASVDEAYDSKKRQENNRSENDDLSLPASILGKAPEVESEDNKSDSVRSSEERQKKEALEDA